MAEDPQRERLMLLRANFVQQMDDAAALVAELPAGSADTEAACEWLADSQKAIERIDAMLSAGVSPRD
jgi:hypothetical protein